MSVREAAKALKPCPFCGNAEPLLQEHPPHTHFIADMPDHNGSWTLECVVCNVGMIEDEPGAKDRLIERWNRRTALADTVEVPREATPAMIAAFLNGYRAMIEAAQEAKG